MTNLVIQVDETAYRTKDFPSFESFYRHSGDNVVVFSIDGADWVEHGENTENPTDKAMTAHKRFLHHLLSQYHVDVSEIALLEGCYDGRKEFSYAVSANLFYSFVQELGYVTEQHSYLVLETPCRIESNAGVFGTNQAPRVILVDNDSGDTILEYSRIEKLEKCFLQTSLGWTYCSRSETFYELVK